MHAHEISRCPCIKCKESSGGPRLGPLRLPRPRSLHQGRTRTRALHSLAHAHPKLGLRHYECTNQRCGHLFMTEQAKWAAFQHATHTHRSLAWSWFMLHPLFLEKKRKPSVPSHGPYDDICSTLLSQQLKKRYIGHDSAKGHVSCFAPQPHRLCGWHNYRDQNVLSCSGTHPWLTYTPAHDTTAVTPTHLTTAQQ
uniref:Uncharacterized protein n=1 Tax=Dunaliella tertiolecta TaxID=3047 RepID=A0A7S3QTJ7_DUNTE